MKINRLKFLGIMIFATILMDVVSFVGFIRFGNVFVTNLPIPAILTAIVLGPGYAVPIGAIFGIISLMRAVARETAILDILLQNPMVTIIPRMCFPLIPGFLYRHLHKTLPERWDLPAVSFCSAVGSISNTVLILGTLYMFYPNSMMEILKITEQQDVLRELIRIFGPSVLTAACICTVVCTLTVYGIKWFSAKAERKKGSQSLIENT